MIERWLLMYGVLPAWLAAGVLDWALHRRTRIEANAGLRESLLHMLMLAEMGAAVLAVLWLQVDALVFGFCVAVFVLHEATVYADLRWAVPRRPIGPVEQMVHSFQELLPLAGLALLLSASWEPLRSALDVRGAAWPPRLKAEPLPPAYLVAAHAAGMLVFACYAEELWRCLRARRR